MGNDRGCPVAGGSTGSEPLDLGEELGEGRVSLEEYVISAFQRDEARPGNETGEVAPLFERDRPVTDGMQNQCWCYNPPGQVTHIELVEGSLE
jgi:hypothetical protein